MISDFELESLEYRYFETIITFLRQDTNKLIDGLNSRIKILHDWRSQFLETVREKRKRPSDLKDGAERIFHHLFSNFFYFPNSCPIGSDLMYQTEEAIIHIEVKTSLITNPDYRGKVQLGRNQISYGTPKFKPHLPTYYKTVSVPTLTYVIQIVNEHLKPKINALNVICVPNGQLFKYYGESILNAGKQGWKKAKDIRYNYSKQPYFVLLKEKNNKSIFRIEIVLLDRKMSIKQLTGKNIPIKPYKRI